MSRKVGNFGTIFLPFPKKFDRINSKETKGDCAYV